MKINSVSMYGDNNSLIQKTIINAPLKKRSAVDPLENIKNLAKKRLSSLLVMPTKQNSRLMMM